ncbi:Fumarylacetoacetate (FAA) hydrolase family [Lotmaria passim]
MAALAFPLRQTVLPIVGKGAKKLNFPVRRIYCVGQNYDSHAREMGGSTCRHNPFFFCHPTDSLVTDWDNHSSADATVSIHYPPLTESYHHEVELVAAIGLPGSGVGGDAANWVDAKDADGPRYANVAVEQAHEIICGYAVGLDMTRRDLQSQAKVNGKPWDLAKGADEGVVVSPLMPASDLKAAHPELFLDFEKNPRKTVLCGEIFLNVNKNERQKGNLSCMVSPVTELIAHLSKAVALRPGDLIFTGTPSGVGAVRPGDVMQAGICGIGTLLVTVL